MYIYGVYTAMSCIHKILKFTHRKAKTVDMLHKFPFGDLLCIPCLSSVYCSSLYIRHRVPGDL